MPGEFGSTLASGIQDISALLPLLGTEQCEQHVGSGLSRGYLYPAAAPMSIFGSLGIALAAVKTCGACIGGAKWLADAGFKASGDNLALLMSPSGDGSRSSSLAEAKLNVLLTKLWVAKHQIRFGGLSWSWNCQMILATAIFSLLGICPYIHLTLLSNRSPLFLRITYPLLRCLGSFGAVVSIQILLQIDILRILQLHLDITEKSNFGNLKWLGLTLLIVSTIAIVVGYIGSFTIVQNSESAWAPYLWLAIEAILSICRIYLWSLNPEFDDHFIKLFSNLDPTPPRFACDQYAEEIEKQKHLPLTEPTEFLDLIVAYAGPIAYFHHPNFLIYYSFSREQKTFARILYISVYDPSRGACRVLSRKPGQDSWTLYQSDPPIGGDAKRFLRGSLGETVELDEDFIFRDKSFSEGLKNHYEAISNRLWWRDTQPAEGQPVMETQWTWTLEVLSKSLNDERSNANQADVQRQHDASDLSYFEDGILQNKQNQLIERSAEWIQLYLGQMSQHIVNYIRQKEVKLYNIYYTPQEECFSQLLHIAHIFWCEHEILKAAMYLQGRTMKSSPSHPSTTGHRGATPAALYRMTLWEQQAFDRLDAQWKVLLAAMRVAYTDDMQDRVSKVWRESYQKLKEAWTNAIDKWGLDKGFNIEDWSSRQHDLYLFFGDLFRDVDNMEPKIAARFRMWFDIFTRSCFNEFSRGGPLAGEDLRSATVEGSNRSAFAVLPRDTHDYFPLCHFERLLVNKYTTLLSEMGWKCIQQNIALQWINLAQPMNSNELESVVKLLNGIMCWPYRCITVIFDKTESAIPVIDNADITSVVVNGDFEYQHRELLDRNRIGKIASLTDEIPGPFIFLDFERTLRLKHYVIAFWGPKNEEFLNLVVTWKYVPKMSSSEDDIFEVSGIDKAVEFHKRIQRRFLIFPIHRLGGVEKEEGDKRINFLQGSAQTLTVRIKSAHIEDLQVELLSENFTPLTSLTVNTEQRPV